MPFFLQDFLIEIAIHAGGVFLSKFTLHITITKCTGYDPASPSSLGAIMDTIKPALRDSGANHITGFINIWPVAAFFIFPTVEPSYLLYLLSVKYCISTQDLLLKN
jgi:hypothetical protein